MMSVQVDEPAGLFLRKEPTTPQDKRRFYLQQISVAVVQSLASQLLICAYLLVYEICLCCTCECGPDDYWSWW
jgi:hypothetical protein